MKVRVIALAVTFALAALASSSAPASAKFANCRSVGCVNRKLNQLHKLDVQETRAIRHVDDEVFNCEKLLPVTLYGTPPSTGYLYYDGVNTFRTDALSETEPGDSPSGLVVVDVCSGSSLARTSLVPHLLMSGR